MSCTCCSVQCCKVMCRKCSRGFFEAAWATQTDPAVCRVRDRRPSPGKHRASRRLNCYLIMLRLWETIQMVSHYKGCVCVQATLISMRPRERRETATVCRTENRWHAVMRLCHSLSENKTLLFICHLLQLSLYPLSVSVLPNQTCWKLHLMLQFRSCGEQSFARQS